MRRWGLPFVLCLGCGPSVDVGDDGTESADGTTTEAMPSTTQVPPTTDTPNLDLPSPGLGGFCVPQCDTPRDCCGGAPDCPSDEYPFNYSCVDGGCVNGGCSADEQCAIISPDWICVEVGNFGKTCAPLCELNRDCREFSVEPICVRGPDGRGSCDFSGQCTQLPGVCDGYGSCDPDTGFCLCNSDDECDFELVCAPF